MWECKNDTQVLGKIVIRILLFCFTTTQVCWSHQRLPQRKSLLIWLEFSRCMDLPDAPWDMWTCAHCPYVPVPSWTVFSARTEQLHTCGFPLAHTIHQPGSLVFTGELSTARRTKIQNSAWSSMGNSLTTSLFSIGKLKTDISFITCKTVQIVMWNGKYNVFLAIFGRVGSLLSLIFASGFIVYSYSIPFSGSSQTVFVICGLW